ncbi:MAG: hypothetical protein ACXV3S_11555 [Kineosporiaceae bacterium]
MDAPYRRGDQVVWLALDEEGMRVYRAEVTDVSPEAAATWLVATTRGQERVNDQGEGRHLVPMDTDIAEEFDRHGDGFLVRSSRHDLDAGPDHSIDRDAGERDPGRGE